MDRHTPLTAVFALAAAALFVSNPALAEEMDEPHPADYTIQVGLLGYSPVSYFEPDGPRPGSAEHRVEYDGVTYFFNNAQQVQAFNADPQRYLPAYGGWCAYGAAVEQHFPIDPTVYKIVDGRLMLFLKNDQANALELWNAGDEAELTRRADAYWAKTHGEDAHDHNHH